MDITKIQSSYSLTIEQVIKDINNSGFQFAVIVRGKKVIGIITDGDIRRCILEKVDLMSSIQTILRKDFIFSLGTPSQEECKNSMIKNSKTFWNIPKNYKTP